VTARAVILGLFSACVVCAATIVNNHIIHQTHLVGHQMPVFVFGMLVLTIPFVMPVVGELGIDPIWFGVFAVMMAELALVTPPIGANVFVMRRTAPEVPMGDIFLGVMPFVIGELIVIALVIAFPEIALWLPGRMR